MPTASLSSGKLFEPEQKASYFIDGRELVLDLNPERVENLEDGAVGGFDEILLISSTTPDAPWAVTLGEMALIFRSYNRGSEL